MGVLGSAVKAWHCAAAELLGRLVINPDNEPFLLPFIPQVNIQQSTCYKNVYILYIDCNEVYPHCRYTND